MRALTNTGAMKRSLASNAEQGSLLPRRGNDTIGRLPGVLHNRGVLRNRRLVTVGVALLGALALWALVKWHALLVQNIRSGAPPLRKQGRMMREQVQKQERDENHQEQKQEQQVTGTVVGAESAHTLFKMADGSDPNDRDVYFSKVLLRPEFLSEHQKRFKKTRSCNVFPLLGAESESDTYAKRQKVCCRSTSEREAKYSCFPSLVVMGAQKGGTTAMHSYLMLDTDIAASSKKELHIWDNDSNFKKTWTKLPTAFPGQSKALPTFESTPSYLASTMACQRMSAWLPPWSVLVVILRDPVKRFWSEIQMKMRRVELQDVTMNSMVDARELLKKCVVSNMHQNPSLNGMGKDECLRKTMNLLAKGSKPKIRAAITRLCSACASGYECIKPRGFINDCLYDAESLLEKRDCFKRFRVLAESPPDLDSIVDIEMRDIGDRCGIIQRAQGKETILQHDAYGREGKDEFEEEEVLLGPAKVPLSGWWPIVKNIENRQGGCARAREKICSSCKDDEDCLTTCLSSRIKRNELWLQGCDVKDVSEERVDPSFITIDDKAVLNRGIGAFSVAADLGYPGINLREIESCRGRACECYPKARNFADISKNFVWRGLYYPQLVNCMKHIPKEQLLIVESEQLRKDLNGTLNSVLRAAGLPLKDWNKHSWEEADKAFDSKYPSFEAITGWSPDGSSKEKIPRELAEKLAAFYKEPNELLFKLLGKRFDHWL